MQANWEHRLLDLAGDIPHPSTKPLFSYWAGDAVLQRAYSACDRITRQNSKSFHMASGLLPEEKRSAVRALYAFCRTVDDVVDESDVEIESKKSALDYWKKVVHSSQVQGTDPIAHAWVDAINRYHIPRHYAIQLIEGVSRDLTQSRYQSFDDLATYCYGVASTVGLMSMYIIGFKNNDALPYAIKLGVALQMTNILRDVGEDYRKGFIYLPQEELIEFGLTEEQIAGADRSENWREFMRFQISRTRQLYADAGPGIRLLEKEGQLAILAASDLYQGILEDIEKNDYDVFNRRARLSAMGKLSRLPSLWWKLRSSQ
jgi:15-cis-phytoene synthase